MPEDTVNNYAAYLASKKVEAPTAGFPATVTNAALWDWQRATVDWALGLGRAALFADTGLGKTRMQLQWAREIADHTGGRVLILAPIAVGAQTVREAKAANIGGVEHDRTGEGNAPITVANYEMLHRFDPSDFVGVVLDESGILKHLLGKMRTRIIGAFTATPYRLACTATPAPNDVVELGNHAQFLGLMTHAEMLARWFVNDAGKSNAWRIKRHAVRHYWDWVSSWARCIGVPSDIGPYSDDGYVLPDLNLILEKVATDLTVDRGDQLFRSADMSATSIHQEKRRTATDRAARVAELIAAEPDEQWLVWVETNYDAQAVMAALPASAEALEVKGPDKLGTKEARLLGFADGQIRTLVTKPKIAGFGLNWQNCARMAFAGPSYSYEALYQAIRRCWRFGQTREVHAHACLAETELTIWQTLERKRAGHETMKVEMFEASRRAAHKTAHRPTYVTQPCSLPTWMRR